MTKQVVKGKNQRTLNEKYEIYNLISSQLTASITSREGLVRQCSETLMHGRTIFCTKKLILCAQNIWNYYAKQKQSPFLKLVISPTGDRWDY